jgi:hypothetical protein
MATKIRIDALMMTETCADGSRTTAMETRSAVAGGLTTTAIEMRSATSLTMMLQPRSAWLIDDDDGRRRCEAAVYHRVNLLSFASPPCSFAHVQN